jgi:hypothetical protein
MSKKAFELFEETVESIYPNNIKYGTNFAIRRMDIRAIKT